MIRKISSKDTYVVRHPVLRPGKPIETCRFDGDDLPTTQHFGFFENGKIIGVATILHSSHDNWPNENCFQLRGMAVLPEFQGKNIGAQLVYFIEKELPSPKVIWFNARISARVFYEKLGYKSIGDIFEVVGIGPHVVMFRSWNS